MDIVKRNSSSPFKLQRSIVDQSGSGGAYETGGYNPEAVFNNDAANAAVESFGKIIGAAISSRTEGDINDSNEAKVKRLQSKGTKLVDKSKNATGDKQIKIDKKIDKIASRIDNKNQAISKYKESINPMAKASLTSIVPTASVTPNTSNSNPFISKGIDLGNKKREIKRN
jgi:hypothetical protein